MTATPCPNCAKPVCECKPAPCCGVPWNPQDFTSGKDCWWCQRPAACRCKCHITDFGPCDDCTECMSPYHDRKVPHRGANLDGARPNQRKAGGPVSESTTHDPLCPWIAPCRNAKSGHYQGVNWGLACQDCIAECRCKEYAKVRADERERVLAEGPYFTSVVHECCVKLQEMQ